MLRLLVDTCNARRLAAAAALLCSLAACRATSAPGGSAVPGRLFPPRADDVALVLWQPGFAGSGALSRVVRLDGTRFAAVTATALRRRFELFVVVVERNPQRTSALRIVDAHRLGSPQRLPRRVTLSLGPASNDRTAVLAVRLGKRKQLIRWDRRHHRLLAGKASPPEA